MVSSVREIPSKPKAVYHSPILFNEDRIRAAAVYCSDGRYGEQFDDFLHNALKLPRYDRLAIAGGPGCFAGHFMAYREAEGAAEHLRFLARVHKLEKVVLIQHEGCAFYREVLNARPGEALKMQTEDLAKAAFRIRQLAWDLNVEAYVCRRKDELLWFEPVEL
jgi:hypothetical protein